MTLTHEAHIRSVVARSRLDTARARHSDPAHPAVVDARDALATAHDAVTMARPGKRPPYAWELGRRRS